ncbi:MAG TPA: gliding motility-associated C-terminal domain-containing protein [Puia sp.]|jgi:gliding motility-associated-like protein
MLRSAVLLLFLILFSRVADCQLILTVAGDGRPGFSGDGGNAVSAQLSGPAGVAIDNNGDLLISDGANGRIRKVATRTGLITTIATGLNGPAGLAVDKAGNVYIAEENAGAIRKIDAGTGNISIFFSLPSAFHPSDVKLDAAGDLYVADAVDNLIREIDGSSHTSRVIAGTGSPGDSGDEGLATQAELNHCRYICLDAADDLFIADQLNNVVRKVDSRTGIITTFAGRPAGGYSGDGLPAVNALLAQPSGLIVAPGGRLLIADSYNHVIRSVDLNTGIISTVAGNNFPGYQGDGGPPLRAEMNGPLYLTLDSYGSIYIVDAGNNVIRKINNCPVFSLGNDVVVCDTVTVTLDATKGNVFGIFHWSTGETTPTIRVSKSGNYWVAASNIDTTCLSRDTVNIKENDCRVGIIYFPGAFSPNGDGKNDVFRPLLRGGTPGYFVLTIFNRWGQKVFETKDPGGSWDGTRSGVPVAPGTYVWRATYQFGEGGRVVQGGTVVVVR